jgi:S1-C subfamily serine protease
MKGKRVVKWLAIGFIVLGIFAVAAGGIVYARMLSDRPASASSAVSKDDTERGVLIAVVEADGPAAEAGVVRGDILLAIGDEPVDTFADLQSQLADLEPGSVVKLTILHGDEQRELTATLGDRNDRSYLGIVPCGDCRAVFAGLGDLKDRLPFDLDELPLLDDPDALQQLRGLVDGALIVTVVEDGPAAEAGLQEGDRITAVDGQALDAENSLADLISSRKPGDEVTLTVERPGDESLEVVAVLGEHPEKAGAAYLGVEYRPAPGMMLHWDQFDPDQLPFQAPEDGEAPFFQPFRMLPGEGVEQGVIIRNVTSGSPAEEAGLSRGDVITAIDGEPVTDPQSIVDAVTGHKPGDVVTLSVIGSGEDEERLVEVTLAEHPEDAERAYLGVALAGFVRQWPSDEDGELEWQAPLRQFLEQFRQGRNKFFGPGESMQDLHFHFDFNLPPELFEKVPALPEKNTL